MLRRVWVWGECVHMCVSLPFTTLWMLELCFHGNADPWESTLFFFHTSSLFAIPLSLPLSHPSFPPTLHLLFSHQLALRLFSSLAIVYQSNKEKNPLFTRYLLLRSPYYSMAVSALSPFRTSLHCWHTFTHKHSASETLLLPLCIQTSFSLSSSLLWISLSPVLYKDTSKDSSHCFASCKQEPSSSVV